MDNTVNYDPYYFDKKCEGHYVCVVSYRQEEGDGPDDDGEDGDDDKCKPLDSPTNPFFFDEYNSNLLVALPLIGIVYIIMFFTMVLIVPWFICLSVETDKSMCTFGHDIGLNGFTNILYTLEVISDTLYCDYGIPTSVD